MKGLEEQQAAARRLGVESSDLTPMQLNALLMNRISDLQERVDLLEKAVAVHEKEKQLGL